MAKVRQVDEFIKGDDSHTIRETMGAESIAEQSH